MNSLVAQMTGRRIHEEASAPVPAAMRQQTSRRRDPRLRGRVTAAMMGVREAEDDESIIPADAQELDTVAGPSGIKIDGDKVNRDREADEPDHPITPDQDAEMLMTPRDALVAPDVTPQAFEPIDPSDVPPPKNAQPRPQAPAPPTPPPSAPPVNPMDVLLGRVTPRGAPVEPKTQDDIPMTVEAAQASVNASLGMGMSGEAALRQGQPMPDPVPAQPGKIMETFFKYGPKPTNSWSR